MLADAPSTQRASEGKASIGLGWGLTTFFEDLLQNENRQQDAKRRPLAGLRCVRNNGLSCGTNSGPQLWGETEITYRN